MINRKTFFAYARRAPFGNRLSPQQAEGMEGILRAWETSRVDGSDLRHLAYIFATAFHETGGRMVPVREGFAKNDKAARAVVFRLPYGKEDFTTKQVYYGRGHVQLTWAANYRKMGSILDLPLYEQPDLALDPEVSARILVEGMTKGLSGKGDFTGRALEDFFNSGADNPVAARAIVNGRDKADLIAGYYRQFLGALLAADDATPQPKDVTAKAAEPDSPKLTTDKTVLGGLTGMLGAGGAGLLGAINNPWALGALVVVVIGVALFLTGRLEIRHRSGA